MAESKRPTVKELKEAIKDLPDEMPVSLEGCDCINPWNGEISTEYGDALLCRIGG